MNIRDHEVDGEPPSADVHAGEYVLGVLDAQARREAQARIEREPAFARLVADWERRLSALIAEIDPAAVPAHVWPRVRTQLGWPPVEGARPGALQSVGFWRAATALAAAAAVAAFFIGRIPQPVPQPPAPPPQVVVQQVPVAGPVTTLAQDDGKPAYLASIDVQQGRLTLLSAPTEPDAQGRVPELWLIPAGEAPRSLGVVDVGKARSIAVPDDLRRALVVGSTLAISLEPPGGAPAGAPTGPIIAKGGIVSL